MLGQARSLLTNINSEMEIYWEDRSEEWQNSERGENFTERMESIMEIATLLQDLTQ